HAAAYLRHHHARRRRGPARGADRRPPRRSAHHHALRPGQEEPRPAPELHPRRVHGLRHLTPSKQGFRAHLNQGRLSAPRPHQSIEGRANTTCTVISTSARQMCAFGKGVRGVESGFTYGLTALASGGSLADNAVARLCRWTSARPFAELELQGRPECAVRWLSLSLITPCVVTLAACGSSSSPRGEVVSSAGLRLVGIHWVLTQVSHNRGLPVAIPASYGAHLEFDRNGTAVANDGVNGIDA